MVIKTENDESKAPGEKTTKKPLLGWGVCGSFCTLGRACAAAEQLRESYDIVPIVNRTVGETDTRFGKAAQLVGRIAEICGKEPIRTIKDAEPLGPARPLDLLLIAPCTGNTLSKIAHGITDTPVTMAAKAHLRSDRPLIIALASNDALSGSFPSLARCAMRKNIFFVPLAQDDPQNKPYSLVCDFFRIPQTLQAAADRRQLQPVIAAKG